MEALSVERLSNGRVQFFARPSWAVTIVATVLSAALLVLFSVAIYLAVVTSLVFLFVPPVALVLELCVVYVVCFRNRYLLISDRLVIFGLVEYDARRVVEVEVEKDDLVFRFENRRVSFFKGLPREELAVARDVVRETLCLNEKYAGMWCHDAAKESV